MSDADRAYAAALKQIETVRAAGATELRLDGKTFRALTDIPPQVTGIKGLKILDLDKTQVSGTCQRL